MAKLNIDTNNNRFYINHPISTSNPILKLATENTFIDKDIWIQTPIGNKSISINNTPSGTVTAAISLVNNIYGATTIQPLSGDYLTITPIATANTGITVTATASITTAGYLDIGDQSTGLTFNPNIEIGSAYYIQESNITITDPDINVTSSNEVNVTGMITSATSTPYAVSAVATETLTVNALTVNSTAGVVPVQSNIVKYAATSTNQATTASTVYIPEGEITVSSGDLTIADISDVTPTITANWGNGDSNISGCYMGETQSTTTEYPYYIHVPISTNTITGSVTASTPAIKYSNNAGYITTATNVTVRNATTSNKSFTISSASKDIWFGVSRATVQINMSASSGVCEYSSSTNMTVSDTNSSGVGITFTGSGNVGASATVIQGGYVEKDAVVATSAAMPSNNSSATKYITGVTIVPPTSGTRAFSITIPNGSTEDFITFNFYVDSLGNTTIAD